MTRRIAAHPIVAFVILAYGFSYLVGAPFLIAVQAWLPIAPGLGRDYLGRLLVVFGPALAAVVVTSALGGRPGLQELLARFRTRPADAGWWLVLPVLGLALGASGFLLAGVAPAALVGRLAHAWPLLLLHLALQWIVIGVGEETGWRGWLLPALLRRHNRLAASALLAATWGLWHLPILVSGLRTAAVFLAGVGALTILFTALWSRTRGNLALLALAHASFNAPSVFFEGAFGSPVARSALERSVAILTAAAFLLLVGRWRWWRERPEARSSQPAAAAAGRPAT